LEHGHMIEAWGVVGVAQLVAPIVMAEEIALRLVQLIAQHVEKKRVVGRDHGLEPVLPMPTPREKAEMAVRHLRMAVDFKGEPRAVREMRKHIAWYLKGVPGSA